jgi:Undecaprenyl-phosphate glucose phosphotransferase
MENGNSRILFVIDLTIIFSFYFATYRFFTDYTFIPLKCNILMVLIVICWFLISVNSDILKINCLSNISKIFKDILIAYSVLSTLIVSVVLSFGNFKSNEKLIIYPIVLSIILSSTTRIIYLIIAKCFHRYGCYQKSVLIIGNGNLKDKLINKFLSSPELGIHINCILTDDPFLSSNSFRLGKINQYCDFLNSYQFDEVFIIDPLIQKITLQNIVQLCEQNGIRFYIIPDYFEFITKWTILNSLGDFPVIAVRNEPLNIFSNRIIKRSFDIVVSMIGLIVLSPIFIIAAIGVKLSSPGPFLFRQKRIGNNNVEFTLFKLRSMIDQPLRDSDTIWTIPDDKRVTPFGRILRKTNLDELPQLWNVLVGDMSIVGPRPEREYFVEKFSMQIPNYRIRHRVKSGITGLAQANGWRGNTSIQKRIENDLYYLENWSLWLDLKIIFMTFFNRAAWKNAI